VTGPVRGVDAARAARLNALAHVTTRASPAVSLALAALLNPQHG